ncbi:MAG: hypothetical protein GX564_09550, partial [Oligosphaeraceae bacterium]|nr:hypothetical protein [Oligosphaeraceae bacterium]
AGETDHSIIVDAASGKTIATVLPGHYFTSVYVHGGCCYCFAARLETPCGWRCHHIDVIQSQDLRHWSEPRPVVSCPDELLYNTAAVYDGRRHLLLYESDDAQYPKFTFKFLESADLVSWRPVEPALFGQSKYVGGPALYFLPSNGHYYLTYVNEFYNHQTGALNYNTRIARSRDLTYWEEGRRPVLEPDYEHQPDPVHHPEVYEINASDAEFVELDGKVEVYCCGGNQQGIGDAAMAEYQGTLETLLQSFFP